MPFITYPNGNASAKIGTMVPFKVEFAGPQPDRVELYADQTLIGEVSGQRAFYIHLEHHRRPESRDAGCTQWRTPELHPLAAATWRSR